MLTRALRSRLVLSASSKVSSSIEQVGTERLKMLIGGTVWVKR
jgi:hypothetical protein